MNHSTSKRLSEISKTPLFKEKLAYHKRMLILGEKIYGRRKDLNLSQSELAARAETTQRIISELENGSYAPSQGIGEDMYDKLAAALEIDRDYLFSEKIDRRTFELFAFIEQKLNWKGDIMQLMKLPYFVDLNIVKTLGFQLTNFKYIRYGYGPFDKKVYAYKILFENKYDRIKFSYIKDFLSNIESTLEALPINSGSKLKRLSYETKPMIKLGATLNGKEGWLKDLDLNTD